MKSILSLLIACCLLIPVMGQEPDTVPPPEPAPAPEVVEEVEAPEAAEASEEQAIDKAIEEAKSESSDPADIKVSQDSDKTRVTLGKNEVIIVEENGDTVVVGLGSKGISIVETDDGVAINVLDMEEKKVEKRKHKRSYFDPHWAGLELGMNNYLTPDNSLVLPPGQEFMDLNTGKSWNWNINFVDFGIGLGTRYVGLVSGLGFEFVNYNFDRQNSIMKDPVSGNIVEYVPPYAGNINKSKLYISYITAPLLMEFHIPVGGHRNIRIAGGVIGGAKMCSHTKIKYTESGDKSKEKNKSDFNLSPLRWGVTARIGYGEVNLFANYYMTPLFKNGMGPELYPFTVGLAIVP